MGYIIVIARLPGIYGNVNRPCPRAAPSDSGRFTAINPWPRAITITYLLSLEIYLNTPRASSLTFPVMFPQTMINTHVLPLVGMSTQVTVVWLVVAGQLPQFDARML